MNSAFLFVYGSLLDQDNEIAIFLGNNSVFYSRGKVSARLYDIGEYPGAVLLPGAGEYIYGNVLKINAPEQVFKLIDDYEGYGAEQLWPNEFIRVLTEIEIETGLLACWIYLYNLPVNGLSPIKGGQYFK